MARSILPSTARRHARYRKQRSGQRARARNEARLRRLMDHLDDLDGFEEPLDRYDLDDTGWDGMVDDRREADKVAPLIRWAEARIARNRRLATGDYWARRNYFARLLGDTVVGRHALQHLDGLFGEENPYLYGRSPGRLTVWELAERRRVTERAEHDERARMLADVLDGADERRLNERITALTPPIEEHWGLDSDGHRVRTGQSGDQPWVLDENCEAWLAVSDRGPTGAQAIAFEALAEVHAEMFGA